VELIKRFIQDYHEKDEEDYLFPRFAKAGKMTDLVKVLRDQHEKGRKLIAQVERQATAARLKTGAGRAQIGGLLRAFNRMYRPHAAREDTVLYPAFRAVVSPAEFDALGDSFEDKWPNWRRNCNYTTRVNLLPGFRAAPPAGPSLWAPRQAAGARKRG
jgi:hemerythrin-like domain-containing protein